MADTQLIRVRYWTDKLVRGARSSGVEYHGLEDAPDSVLLGLRGAVNDVLSARNDVAIASGKAPGSAAPTASESATHHKS